MGVLNVTPDSFFAPSRAEGEAAVARGRALAAHGRHDPRRGRRVHAPRAARSARTSSSPGSCRWSPPSQGSVRVSVDTVKPSVARAAVGAGATLLNDVSGTLAPLAAELGVGWVSHAPPRDPRSAAARRRSAPGSSTRCWTTCSPAHVRPATSACTRSTSTPASASARTARTTSRCSRTSRSSVPPRTPRASACSWARAASGSWGALPHGAHLDADDRFEGSLAVAVHAMVCGVDVIRVHDVAATVQAASLVGEWEAA